MNKYLKSTVLLFAIGCNRGEIIKPPSESGYFITSPNDMSDKATEKYLDNMEVQGWRLISYTYQGNKFIFHKP